MATNNNQSIDLNQDLKKLFKHWIDLFIRNKKHFLRQFSEKIIKQLMYINEYTICI